MAHFKRELLNNLIIQNNRSAEFKEINGNHKVKEPISSD